VRVRRFGEGRRWRWCIFNASVSAREGRRWDEALSENETEAVSSFLVQCEGSMIRHRSVTTSIGGDAVLGSVKGGDDTSWDDANPYYAKKMKKKPCG
jgi:hypothetical protein